MTNTLRQPLASRPALPAASLQGGDRFRVPAGRRFVLLVSLAASISAIVPGPGANAQSSAARGAIAPGGNIKNQRFVRKTRDMLGYELLPSVTDSFKAELLRTNRWGMRDKEYALTPPPNTYRIALLGSSFTMGGGVPMEQTFEAVLEDRLNREGPGAPRTRYEILNFSVGGYGVLQNLVVADKKAFRFAPNAVFIVIHSIEENRIMNHLMSLLRQRIPIDYPDLQQKLQEVGVRPGMESPEFLRRLDPIARDLVKWSYQRIAQLCREKGVPLVGIAFLEPGGARATQLAQMTALASAAGIPVLTLGPVYNGYPVDSVKLRSTDLHLSALGHRLVANRVFQLLRANDARTLHLGFLAR